MDHQEIRSKFRASAGRVVEPWFGTAGSHHGFRVHAVMVRRKMGKREAKDNDWASPALPLYSTELDLGMNTKSIAQAKCRVLTFDITGTGSTSSFPEIETSRRN